MCSVVVALMHKDWDLPQVNVQKMKVLSAARVSFKYVFVLRLMVADLITHRYAMPLPFDSVLRSAHHMTAFVVI